MSSRSWLFLFLIFFQIVPIAGRSQQTIDPHKITIARDSFGVPHIFAKTDAEAAYGLAFAHAEDDFENIQYAMLAAQGDLGRVKGTDGVLFDFALEAFEVDHLVDNKYLTDLSEDYRAVLDGYAQGLNAYAALHPEEVLYKKAFPVEPSDIIKGYVLGTSLMAGLGMALKAVMDDRIEEFYYANDVGSNAVAVAPDRMEDGKGYLLSNSHQPNEGRFAWWEAHVQSEEGWNIIGGLFPGGTTIFVGSNQNLGWSHTTNYHNFGDIYALEMHPKKKWQYKYGGEWKTLKTEKIKLQVKIAGIVLPVKKRAFWSEYGPVLKTKRGYFAFRFPGYMDIRSGEQWYRMNKATNFDEFEAALKMQAIPLFNVVYADKEGNILMHSGGMIPKRDPALNWKQPILSDDPVYKWTEIQPYDRMPLDVNPPCGFVYNSNNTPLHCTGDSCEWVGDFPGLQLFEYNRGDVYGEFMKNYEGKFSMDALDEIKFNTSYAPDGTYMAHFRNMYTLDESRYPEIADAIQKVKGWNLQGDIDNEDAALIMIAHDFLRLKCDCPFALLMIREQKITEEEAVWALTKAKKVLMKYYGTLDVPLGKVQRLVRGEVSLPVDGLREVPRAADTKAMKNGVYRVKGGDSYILIARYDKKNGAEVKSVNAYGASNKAGSPHYTDQMEMFVNHEFKDMPFDKETILKTAERVYSPVMVVPVGK